MKKVIGQYANAVIAICVVLGVSGVVQNLVLSNGLNLKGYLRGFVENMLPVKPDVEEEKSAFDHYMDTNGLCFSISYSDLFTKGRTVPISWIMEAVDSTGKLKTIQIIGCWDERFQQTKAVDVLQNTALRFRQDGIFWIEVSAVDVYGDSRNACVKIYVNAR